MNAFCLKAMSRNEIDGKSFQLRERVNNSTLWVTESWSHGLLNKISLKYRCNLSLTASPLKSSNRYLQQKLDGKQSLKYLLPSHLHKVCPSLDQKTALHV